MTTFRKKPFHLSFEGTSPGYKFPRKYSKAIRMVLFVALKAAIAALTIAKAELKACSVAWNAACAELKTSLAP